MSWRVLQNREDLGIDLLCESKSQNKDHLTRTVNIFFFSSKIVFDFVPLVFLKKNNKMKDAEVQ